MCRLNQIVYFLIIPGIYKHISRKKVFFSCSFFPRSDFNNSFGRDQYFFYFIFESPFFNLSCKVLFYFSLVAGKTPEDRKSTRLNSSHVAISYAVFCVKKKHTLTLTLDYSI